MRKTYSVYILSNNLNTVYYTGITGDLYRRVYEHKHRLVPGFTKKYFIHKLLYFEDYYDVKKAIAREKTIKRWKREWKNNVIKEDNPNFEDLAVDWYE